MKTGNSFHKEGKGNRYISALKTDVTVAAEFEFNAYQDYSLYIKIAVFQYIKGHFAKQICTFALNEQKFNQWIFPSHQIIMIVRSTKARKAKY